jgi:hypothetical protein
MAETMQTCQNLASMTASQIVDEDRYDPFPARTTSQICEMLSNVRRTKAVLAREALLYSQEADFSVMTDSELSAMNTFVKDSSRTLTIMLAGSREQFFMSSGSSLAEKFRKMSPYVEEKVKQWLKMDQIIDLLDINRKPIQKPGSPGSPRKGAATNPDLLAFFVIDAAKGDTSEVSLIRLADSCERFAEQCRRIASKRAGKLEDMSRKSEIRDQLLKEIEALLPLVQQHALKIGIHATHCKKETPKESANMANTHVKLIRFFTYESVEEAHRAVQTCADLLQQEILYRKKKVARRILREEEEAAAAEQKKKEEFRLQTENYLQSLQAKGLARTSKSDLMSTSRTSLTGRLSLTGSPSAEALESPKTPKTPKTKEAADSPSRSKSPKERSPSKPSGSPTKSPSSPGGRVVVVFGWLRSRGNLLSWEPKVRLPS